MSWICWRVSRRQHIICLDEDEHGLASLSEPLFEALLNEGVFLALERGKQALRRGVGLQLRNLGRERRGQNRDRDDEPDGAP